MADIFSNKRIEEMMQKQAHGTEPDALQIRSSDPAYTSNLMRAFNWYNYEKDIKVARSYLRSWVKAQKTLDVKRFDSVVDLSTAPVYGWMARLATHGAELSAEHSKRLQDYVQDLMGEYRAAASVMDNPVALKKPSIQDAMLEKQREFLGLWEGEFDNFILNDCRSTEFDVFKYMQGTNLARPYAQALSELLTSRIAEYVSAAESTDEQIIEGYSCYTAAQKRRIVQWLETCKEAVNRYLNFKKANQKVRVKKAKPAGVQVAKLQYLKEFAELNLTSISPTRIVGAAQLWVYNTKNKKLGVYYATGAAGFSVRGTSLQGWDPAVSTQNALRKPEVIIPQVLEGGKLVLNKLLGKLTTKNTSLNGRINAYTILIRVL
jgi:hypothetical protein